MPAPQPRRPKNLNPLAAELLEGLAGHPECAEIVLGGGVALSHYLEYRSTVDVDAWWREAPSEPARERIRTVLGAMGARHGLDFRERKWGETESFELSRGEKKVFSTQISFRTRYLETPVGAEWPPLALESFRDNLASKMTALVERGAPRDFRDLFALCHEGLTSVGVAWELYAEKNPHESVRDARRKVLNHLERIGSLRPLEDIQPKTAREEAAKVREWFASVFCNIDPA